MNAVDIESWVLMRSARAVATNSSKLRGSSSAASALMMSESMSSSGVCHSSADECDQIVLHFAELMSRTDHVLTRVGETELRQIGAAPALDRAHFEIVNLQLLMLKAIAIGNARSCRPSASPRSTNPSMSSSTSRSNCGSKRFHTSPAECLRQQASHAGVTRWIDVRDVRERTRLPHVTRMSFISSRWPWAICR